MVPALALVLVGALGGSGARAAEGTPLKPYVECYKAIAPFTVALVPVSMHKSERLRLAVEEIYGRLCAAGVDVLLDDRQDRLGVMLNDIELLGIPHRLVLSDRGLDAGTVEYQGRRDAAKQDLPLGTIVEFLRARIAAALA